MMSNKKIVHIIILVVILLTDNVCAENRSYLHRGHRPAYSLGGGGSQYANRKRNRLGLLTGAYSGRHYLIGAYAEGAYAGLPSTLPQVRFTPGGYFTSGGLVFEFEQNRFMFQIGAGVAWQDVQNSVSDTIFSYSNVIDKWGYPFTLNYDFHNRKDRMRELFLQVPILFGCRFSDHFYMLGGAKLTIPLNGRTSMKAEGTTTGTYNQFLGVFEEMDNHGLRKNVPIERNGSSFKMSWDVMASLEVGYEFGAYAKGGYRGFGQKKYELDWRGRIALYADFGLLNINPKLSYSYLTIPKNEYRYDFPKYEMVHVFNSNLTTNYNIHNFNIGLRFTILIGFIGKERCIICGPFGVETDF